MKYLSAIAKVILAMFGVFTTLEAILRFTNGEILWGTVAIIVVIAIIFLITKIEE